MGEKTVTYLEVIAELQRLGAAQAMDSSEALDVYARLQRDGSLTREDVAQDNFQLSTTAAAVLQHLADVRADEDQLGLRRGRA